MATRELGVPFPGGINAAIAWANDNDWGDLPLDPVDPRDPADDEKPVPRLHHPKPNRATCSCGCQDWTGEAIRCASCEEPLYR